MFSELLDNVITALLISFEIAFQVIRKEKQLQQEKQNEQFYQYDRP